MACASSTCSLIYLSSLLDTRGQGFHNFNQYSIQKVTLLISKFRKVEIVWQRFLFPCPFVTIKSVRTNFISPWCTPPPGRTFEDFIQTFIRRTKKRKISRKFECCLLKLLHPGYSPLTCQMSSFLLTRISTNQGILTDVPS